MKVLSIIFPIFIIILVGYLCGKFNKLGEHAASELNKAVVWIFLPALLFKVCATVHISEIWNTGFFLSYTIPTFLIFFVIIALRYLQQHDLSTAAVDGLSASYSNTGYIGIPLCVFLLGDFGLQPAMIATLIVVVLLFAITIMIIEMTRQKADSFARTLLNVIKTLLVNPIVVAPILGFAYSALSLPMSSAFLNFLEMLALATSPCALVSLGLFLSKKQVSISTRSFMPLIAAKLFIQPALTAILALLVFRLPKEWAHAAIILSALPTGTGPYMIAELYRTEAKTVSDTILWSTIISVMTLSVILMWL